eukprot:jgi/Tetstr1/461700/TSEL_006800.t1
MDHSDATTRFSVAELGVAASSPSPRVPEGSVGRLRRIMLEARAGRRALQPAPAGERCCCATYIPRSVV